jgi:hypothetical protein
MNFTPPPHPHSDGFADAISADPGQDGEALRAGDSWREVHRVDRLRSVVIAREACTALILRIERGMACQLPDREQSLFDMGGDPHLALSRTITALGRMVVLEDRLDESAEQRTARLAAEAAEREKARLAEQARQNRRRMEAVLEKKQAHIRRAVAMAHRDAEPDMRPIDRVTKLDDLFGEFDDYGDWDDDPVKIVADLCIQLGLHAPLPKGSTPRPKNKAEQAERARAYTLETAQCYLDWTAESDPAEPGEPDTPPPRSQGLPGQ